MRSYFPPLHQVAALLLAAVMALTLGLRAAEATPCKGAGAACPTNRSCCSGLCVGATSGGRHHTSGVCAGGNGRPCTVDSQCASTHFVYVVCCDTACTAPCHGCSAAKTGGTNGTCAPDTAGTACDDDQFCTTTDTCDGSGNCVGSGNPCPLSGQSVDCSQCLEATDACGTLGEGLPCGEANGQTCAGASQCTSTHCVDGVCCDMACDGTCEACSAVKTGGTDGTCAPIPEGMDPDGECPDQGPCGLDGSCDGSGACQFYASGTACDDHMFCNGTDTCDGVGNCSLHSGNPCSPTACPACGFPNF